MKTTIYTTKPNEAELIARVEHEFLNGIASLTEKLIGVHSLALLECLIEMEAITDL